MIVMIPGQCLGLEDLTSLVGRCSWSVGRIFRIHECIASTRSINLENSWLPKPFYSYCWSLQVVFCKTSFCIPESSKRCGFHRSSTSGCFWLLPYSISKLGSGSSTSHDTRLAKPSLRLGQTGPWRALLVANWRYHSLRCLEGPQDDLEVVLDGLRRFCHLEGEPKVLRNANILWNSSNISWFLPFPLTALSTE